VTKKSPTVVDFFVEGPPHSQKPWATRLIDAALEQPRLLEECELDVDFVFSADRVPWILPSETSLRSVLSVLLDVLEDTVLRGSPGESGSVVTIRARSRVSNARIPAGTHIVLRPSKAQS